MTCSLLHVDEQREGGPARDAIGIVNCAVPRGQWSPWAADDWPASCLGGAHETIPRLQSTTIRGENTCCSAVSKAPKGVNDGKERAKREKGVRILRNCGFMLHKRPHPSKGAV